MFRRGLLISAILVTLAASPAGAHGGHIHAPSIGRDSHAYLQKCIPLYLQIQAALAEGRLDEGLKQAAQKLTKQARSGAIIEREASGRTMLMGISMGAKTIISAKNLEAARQGFGQINNAMLPFFIIWSSHLKEHQLNLFYCADKEALKKRDKIDFTKGWLQKADKAQSPYGGALCPNLQVEKGEK